MLKKFFWCSVAIFLSVSLAISNIMDIDINTGAIGVSENIETKVSEKIKSNVTNENVIAGVATPYELYGEMDCSEIPDAVVTDNNCEYAHIRRAYEDEGDSLHTVVFENADSTKTMYLFDYPIKYKNSNGDIVDISLEINHGSKEGRFESQRHSFQASFSKNSAEGVMLTKDDFSITLVPLANSSIKGTELQSAAIQKDKKTISYYYDSKTDIEYSLTYAGIKEDIVVKEYTGQTEYSFKLFTKGLTLQKRGDNFCLVDTFNQVRAYVGDIIIFTSDEKNNTFGRLTFETIKARQEYIMTIHIDKNFLMDQNTVYPIRIDPTIEINYNNNGSGAIQDVTLNSNYISNTASTALSIGRRSNTFGISRALLKFPGLNLEAIPSAERVTDAYVEIRDLMCESEALNIQCHLFKGNSWNENTVSWENVDANNFHSAVLSQNSISYSNGTKQSTPHRYRFNITSAVQNWKKADVSSNPMENWGSKNKGIIFKAENNIESGTTSKYKTIASYNNTAYRPSLVVTYSVVDEQLIADGTYYLNNSYTGHFIKYNGSLSLAYGLMDEIDVNATTYAFPLRWHIEKVESGYFIRLNSNGSNNRQVYLGVPTDKNQTSVQATEFEDEDTPDQRYIWNISISAVGGCLIQNVYNANYLQVINEMLYTTQTLGASNNYEIYNKGVWRIVAFNEYKAKEVSSDAFVFNDIPIIIGRTDTVRACAKLKDSYWIDFKDMSFDVESPSIAIVSEDTGKITPIFKGATTVNVVHKPTGVSTSFEIYVINTPSNLGEISTWNDIESNIVGAWTHSIKIYVEDKTHATINGEKETEVFNDLDAAYVYAISYWKQQLNINITTTTNKSEADIEFYGINNGDIATLGNIGFNLNQITNENNFSFLGITTGNLYDSAMTFEGYYIYNGTVKFKKTIEYAKVALVLKSECEYEDYRQAAIHEMGHALGYYGHSGDASGAMFWSANSSNYTLTNKEKQHILNAYN